MGAGHWDTQALFGMFAGGGPGIVHRPEVSVGFGARTRHFPSGRALATPACHWGMIISWKAHFHSIKTTYFSSASFFDYQQWFYVYLIDLTAEILRSSLDKWTLSLVRKPSFSEAASPEPATEGPEWKSESIYLSSTFHSIFRNHLAAQASGTTANKQACVTL